MSQKNQRAYCSGKKERHTLKTQLIVNAKIREIICTAHAESRCMILCSTRLVLVGGFGCIEVNG